MSPDEPVGDDPVGDDPVRAGHVFVVGADLTRLACDDVVVPTDREL